MQIFFPKLERKRYLKGALTRSQGGQALVEFAMILVVLVALAIGLTYLVLNVGMTMVYKQKVAYIAAQTAKYYALQQTSWQGQTGAGGWGADVNAYATSLAAQMGIDPARTPVSAVLSDDPLLVTIMVLGGSATVDMGQGVGVAVTVSNLPLIAGSNLPGNITITEKFVAVPGSVARPTGLLSLQTAIKGVECYIPCYATATTNAKPNIPGPGTYDEFTWTVDPANWNPAPARGTRGTNP